MRSGGCYLLTEQFQKRRKKNVDLFKIYIPVGIREEVEEADNYFESKGIAKNEQYVRGYLEQYRKAKQAEGIFTPFDGYYQKKDEEYEASRKIPRQRILNDIAVELARSKTDPEAEKNALMLADALDEHDLESLTDHAQMRLYVLRKRRAEIANKLTQTVSPQVKNKCQERKWMPPVMIIPQIPKKKLNRNSQRGD